MFTDVHAVEGTIRRGFMSGTRGPGHPILVASMSRQAQRLLGVRSLRPGHWAAISVRTLSKDHTQILVGSPSLRAGAGPGGVGARMRDASLAAPFLPGAISSALSQAFVSPGWLGAICGARRPTRAAPSLIHTQSQGRCNLAPLANQAPAGGAGTALTPAILEGTRDSAWQCLACSARRG